MGRETTSAGPELKLDEGPWIAAQLGRGAKDD
jgi:hypothetical protein